MQELLWRSALSSRGWWVQMWRLVLGSGQLNTSFARRSRNFASGNLLCCCSRVMMQIMSNSTSYLLTWTIVNQTCIDRIVGFGLSCSFMILGKLNFVLEVSMSVWCRRDLFFFGHGHFFGVLIDHCWELGHHFFALAGRHYRLPVWVRDQLRWALFIENGSFKSFFSFLLFKFKLSTFFSLGDIKA